jgi:hypothetical protein
LVGRLSLSYRVDYIENMDLWALEGVSGGISVEILS